MRGGTELTRGHSTGPKGWVDFAERLLELEDPSVELEIARVAIRAGFSLGALRDALHCANLARIHLGDKPDARAIAELPEPESTLVLLAEVADGLNKVLQNVAGELARLASRRAA
jgi:hypothetical protein